MVRYSRLAPWRNWLRCFFFGHQYADWFVTESLTPYPSRDTVQWYSSQPCIFRYCEREDGCWGGEKLLLP